MKKLFFLLSLFLAGSSIYAQYIDRENAPLNPIGFKYKKEHFNLKGDVYAFGNSIFSKDGYLIYENDIAPKQYIYKNGKLHYDTNGRSYEFDHRGYLVKYTFPYLGIQTQRYTYNAKGLLTEVNSTRNYKTTYDYDDQGRLIKSDADGTIKEYSYQKSSDQLLVTVKDFSKDPVAISKKTYKNGELIAQDDIQFKPQLDAAGNHVGDNIIYYSEIENRNNELSVVYTAPSSVSINPIYDCKFYVNGKKADFIYKQVLDYKNLMVYNPFSEKYYIIKDAFHNSKSDQKQVFSEVFIDSPYIYYYESDTYSALYYKGAIVQNSVYLSDKATEMYNMSFLYVYNRGLEMTFQGKAMDLTTRNYRGLQHISPKENTVFFKSDDQYYCFLKGESITTAHPDYKPGRLNDNIIFKNANNEFIYIFPEAVNAVEGEVYEGRRYDPSIDNAPAASKSSANQTGAANASSSGSSTNSDNPYIGLSTEAATFMAVYRLTPKKTGSSLITLHNKWVEQEYSRDKINQSYAAIFKELYAKDKDAAFDFILEIPSSYFTLNKDEIIPQLTTEQKEYVREKAQELIRKGEG